MIAYLSVAGITLGFGSLIGITLLLKKRGYPHGSRLWYGVAFTAGVAAASAVGLEATLLTQSVTRSLVLTVCLALIPLVTSLYRHVRGKRTYTLFAIVFLIGVVFIAGLLMYALPPSSELTNPMDLPDGFGLAIITAPDHLL
jgi:hypothetical protein